MVSPIVTGTDRRFIRQILIVIGAVAICWLIFKLAYAFLLLFGCVVVAVVLRTIGAPIAKTLHISDGLGVLIALLALIGLFAFAGWIFGAQFSAAFEDLSNRVPKAIASLKQAIADSPFQGVVSSIESSAATNSIMSQATLFLKSMATSIADAIFILIGGIYLALDPKAYQRGILTLLPTDTGARIAEAMEVSGRELKLWLLGQFIMMVSIGLLTGIGLWIIGVPAALALGVIAGLLEFIPYFGAIASSVPAIVVAFSQSLPLALWAAGLYLLIHVIEGYLLEPIVYRRMVSLPAVVTLFSVVAAALLFGPMGVVLAAPLAVVVYVSVLKLWIQDVMGRPVNLPDEAAP